MRRVFPIIVLVLVLLLTVVFPALAAGEAQYVAADGDVAIAGVLLIPLIIGFIEALKRLFENAPGKLWFGLSLLFGFLGQVVALLIQENQLPADLAGWASLVVLGLAFGLAASKAYDETIAPQRREFHIIE